MGNCSHISDLAMKALLLIKVADIDSFLGVDHE